MKFGINLKPPQVSGRSTSLSLQRIRAVCSFKVSVLGPKTHYRLYR